MTNNDNGRIGAERGASVTGDVGISTCFLIAFMAMYRSRTHWQLLPSIQVGVWRLHKLNKLLTALYMFSEAAKRPKLTPIWVVSKYNGSRSAAWVHHMYVWTMLFTCSKGSSVQQIDEWHKESIQIECPCRPAHHPSYSTIHRAFTPGWRKLASDYNPVAILVQRAWMCGMDSDFL